MALGLETEMNLRLKAVISTKPHGITFKNKH